MMKVVWVLVVVSLLAVSTAWAGRGQNEDCRTVQRAAQTSVEPNDGSHWARWRNLRTVLRVLREGGRQGLAGRDCQGCIVRQFVGGEPVSSQEPCGAHDVCTVGDRLSPQDDECVAAVCNRRAECCRVGWSQRCVDTVAEACGRACGECGHEACVEGEALHADCGDCVRQVCDGDPYCCDTTWDSQCVEQVETVCETSCLLGASVSTTTTSTTTTSTTTTTEPECRTDADCVDGNACTQDLCAGGVCTSSRISCDDGDPCTVDTCDVVAGCFYQQRSCEDGNGCTVDTCSAPGSAEWSAALAAGSVVSTDGCIHTLDTACRPCDGDVQCEDGNPCTDDVCEGNVCRRSNRIGDCDDGNPCTIGDRCSLGWCVGGPFKNCNDDDACTLDYCDSSGQCQHSTFGCQIGMSYFE